MNFTINSKKLGKTFTFFLASDGGHVYVDTNGKEGTLGEQICKGGHTNAGSTLTATEETLEKVCRNWLRKHIENVQAMEAGEF